MKKLITLIAGISILCAGGAIFAVRAADPTGLDAVFAQDGKGGGDHPILRRIINRIADRLELTPEQRAQIRQILEDERPTVQPMVADLLATRAALKKATAGGTFDEAEVQRLAQHQGQTLGRLIVERERVKAQIYQVLTPAQREKADQFRTRIEERIRERVMGAAL